ncbi:DUF551 domain-containing protein [Klebsiella pneumoniae]|uniref:DUF551 domain-containing protein n=1 Tax=Klebsiella pneumoniae TaxID=573 RepID=UPI0029D86F67|nr:DUF551 domain-containing protein [Klebsiella pneumoniae]MDX6900660.1 DUF551 domain-containing protein [Klebsiella pneumoniae]
MTSKFSIDNRELLQRISSGEAVVGIDFGNLIVRELAAFRLAAMDSEPVGEVIERPCSGEMNTGMTYRLVKGLGEMESMPVGTKFYVAQPAPVVPDEKDKTVDADDHPLLWSFNEGWNACRAAMLAATPHDTPALNSMQSVVTMPGIWIPVSERMPDENAEQQVLACFKGGDISTLYYFEGRWDDAYGIVPIRQDVTHWMPLPAAPQEVKGE